MSNYNNKKTKYRPFVVIADFEVRWMPKKYIPFLKSNESYKVKVAKDSLMKMKVERMPLALNSNDQFPNEEMKKAQLSRLFKQMNLKFDYDNFAYAISNVHKRRVSLAAYEVEIP